MNGSWRADLALLLVVAGAACQSGVPSTLGYRVPAGDGVAFGQIVQDAVTTNSDTTGATNADTMAQATDVPTRTSDTSAPDTTACSPHCDGQSCFDGCGGDCTNAACDDGNNCTVGDKCTGLVCTAGMMLDCSNLDGPCVKGSCQGGKCFGFPVDASCDDGDPCTIADYCANGACTAGPSMDCNALDGPCISGICAQGNCSAVPVAGACDDGNPCTLQDFCSAGQCVAGPSKDCSVYDGACSVGTCDGKGACEPQYVSGSCDDGDACTIDDYCWNGGCLAGKPKCTAGNDECHESKCVAGTCLLETKSSCDSCKDAGDCTSGSGCIDGLCYAKCADNYPPCAPASPFGPPCPHQDPCTCECY